MDEVDSKTHVMTNVMHYAFKFPDYKLSVLNNSFHLIPNQRRAFQRIDSKSKILKPGIQFNQSILHSIADPQ
uniref:Uncharacterized protein n=1 Tax=Kalanchoe fedtschenkoi TaxID=63787 RepID=A0A7N0VAJ2_KALFE